MDEPLISVIIPIYNMELYLERCLDSVLNNTYRNLEVICVDDGSTDRSLEILRRCEEKDPRIVVIAKENCGVSSARNAGLDHMTGEFVTFIDPDDYVHPSFLEVFFSVQKRMGADIIIGGFLEVEDSNQPVMMTPVDFAQIITTKVDCVDVFKNHYLGGYCTARLIRNGVIRSHRFPEMDYGEDGVFFSSLWEQEEWSCYSIDSQLYYYCIRSDSATKTIPYEKRLELIKLELQQSKKDKQNNRIYFVQAICRLQRFLSFYLLTSPNKGAVKNLQEMMRTQLAPLWRSEFFSIQEKLIFTAKCISPELLRKIAQKRNNASL